MGWHQVGCTLPEPQLRKVSFPVAESGLLRQAAKSRGALVEKVSTSKVDNWLVALVGLPERELFAVPIKVNDQPVAILIASKPTQGEAGDHKATYDALAAKISLAIQIASLRKRMLED